MDDNLSPLLQKVTPSLAAYLESMLSSLSEDWWKKYVVPNLTDGQLRQMKQRNITWLAAFDLAALLHIFIRNWSEVSSIKNLTDETHNYLFEMRNVRNRWAHPSSEEISGDDIYRDLDTLQRFAVVIGAEENFIQEIRTRKNLVAKEMLPASQNKILDQKSPQITNNRFEVEAKQTARLGHSTSSNSQHTSQNKKVQECKYGYKYSRLCFKADVIEPLSMEDCFWVETPDGTYVLTKHDFYENFPKVVESKSYQVGRLYHFPKPPLRALKFKIE